MRLRVILLVSGLMLGFAGTHASALVKATESPTYLMAKKARSDAIQKCAAIEPAQGIKAQISEIDGTPFTEYSCDPHTRAGEESACAIYTDNNGKKSESCALPQRTASLDTPQWCDVWIGNEVGVKCTPSVVNSSAITVGDAASRKPAQVYDVDDPKAAVTNDIIDRVLKDGVSQNDGWISLPASNVMQDQYPGLLEKVAPRTSEAAKYLGTESEDDRAARALNAIIHNEQSESARNSAMYGNAWALSPEKTVEALNARQGQIDTMIKQRLAETSSFPDAVVSPIGIPPAVPASTFSAADPFSHPTDSSYQSSPVARESSNVVDLRPLKTAQQTGLSGRVIGMYRSTVDWFQSWFQ